MQFDIPAQIALRRDSDPSFDASPHPAAADAVRRSHRMGRCLGAGSAFIGFAAASLLGAFALSYYCLTGLEQPRSTVATAEPPVYEGRAVPRDDAKPQKATHSNVARLALVPRGKLQSSPAPSETESFRSIPSQPSAVARAAEHEPALPSYSFPEFDSARHFADFAPMIAIANSAAMSNSGNYAPDADSVVVDPVPEPGSWRVLTVVAALLCALQRSREQRRHLARAARAGA